MENDSLRKHHHHASVMEPPTRPASLDEKPVVDAAKSVGGKPLVQSEPLQVNWAAAIWLVALHIGALAAPWTFSWSGLAIAVFLHWVSGSLGICLGFHRLLTHTGLVTPQWVRYSLTFCGILAGEGGPLTWCANHRKHHAFSDLPGDPHSPNDGPWWAHMFWLAFNTDGGDRKGFLKKWVPDLMMDRGMVRLENWFLPIHLILGTAMFAAGWMIGGRPLALSWLVWGVCVRLLMILHTTWFVNSASHIWGYRNYETRDESRNLWWVALIAYGEGWHNNHHAHPRLAQHGHKWWEFDMTYWAIKTLVFLGLAKDVVDLKSMEAKKERRKATKVA